MEKLLLFTYLRQTTYHSLFITVSYSAKLYLQVFRTAEYFVTQVLQKLDANFNPSQFLNLSIAFLATRRGQKRVGQVRMCPMVVISQRPLSLISRESPVDHETHQRLRKVESYSPQAKEQLGLHTTILSTSTRQPHSATTQERLG